MPRIHTLRATGFLGAEGAAILTKILNHHEEDIRHELSPALPRAEVYARRAQKALHFNVDVRCGQPPEARVSIISAYQVGPVRD
jgi:hypothetical protein